MDPTSMAGPSWQGTPANIADFFWQLNTTNVAIPSWQINVLRDELSSFERSTLLGPSWQVFTGRDWQIDASGFAEYAGQMDLTCLAEDTRQSVQPSVVNPFLADCSRKRPSDDSLGKKAKRVCLFRSFKGKQHEKRVFLNDRKVTNETELQAYNVLSVLKNLTAEIESVSNYYVNIISSRCKKDLPTEDCFLPLSDVVMKDDVFENILIDCQKTLHFLIATFKTTVYKYGQFLENKESVLEIYPIFFKLVFRAAGVFNEIKDTEKEFLNSQKLGIRVMENLAQIIIIQSPSVIADILEDIIVDVMEYMLHNPLLKTLSNCLLGHQMTFEIMALVILKQFSDANGLESLKQKDSKKSQLMLSLLGDVFQSLVLFPNGFIIFEKIFFLRRLIQEMETADYLYNYLYVLNSFFLVLHNAEPHSISLEISSLLQDLFKSFDSLLQTVHETKVQQMLLETILTFVNCMLISSADFLFPFIKLVLKTVVISFKEDSDLTLKALVVYENVLDTIDLSFISIYFSPFKKDMLEGLYSALYNPAKDIPVIALRILGKLRAENREKIEDDKANLAAEVNGPYLSLTCKSGLGGLVPLTKVIDHAYQCLADSKSDSFKQQYWSIVKTFLLQFCNEYAKVSNRSLPENYSYYNEKKDYLQVLATAFKAMFVTTDISLLSDDALEVMNRIFETLTRHSPKIEENEELELFFDTALLIMCLPKICEKLNVNILKTIVKTAGTFCDEPDLKDNVLRYIKKTSLCLMDRLSTEEQIIGYKALELVMTSMSEDGYEIIRVDEFVGPLLKIVADLKEKYKFQLSNEAKCILSKLTTNAFRNFSTINEEAYKGTYGAFLKATVSPNYHMRNLGRNFFTEWLATIKMENIHLKYLDWPEEFDLKVKCFLYLHEDFDFSQKLSRPIYQCCEDPFHRNCDTYYWLKSLCELHCHDVFFKEVFTDICSALHALCLSFLSRHNLDKLTEIFTKALVSREPQVRESATKCLQYAEAKILMPSASGGTYTLSYTQMVKNLTCSILIPLIESNTINERYLCYLKSFIEAFSNWPRKAILQLTVKQLKFWKRRLTESVKADKKVRSADLRNVLKIGPYIISILNSIDIHEPDHVLEVMSAMFIIETFLKLSEDSHWKKECLSFCRKTAKIVRMVLLANLVSNKDAKEIYLKHMIKDLLQPLENHVIRVQFQEKDIVLLIKHKKYSYALEILKYLLEHDRKWLCDKNILVNCLLKVWNSVDFSNSEKQILNHLLDLKQLAHCLLTYYIYDLRFHNILFDLMKSLIGKYSSSFTFLKDTVFNCIVGSPVSLKAKIFESFQMIYCLNFSDEFKILHFAVIFEFIIIPFFCESSKKGESKELLEACNELNLQYPSVLQSFLYSIQKLCGSSEKVTLLFLKLSIILAQQFHVLDSYKTLVLQAIEFAKLSLSDMTASENCKYHCLLLLLIKGNAKDLNPITFRDILLKLFSSYPSEDQHIVQEAMRLSVLNFSLEILSPCFKLLIDEKLFGLIMEYSEVFYCVHEEFIGPMLRYASELASQGLNPLKSCNVDGNCLEQGSVNMDPSNNLVQEQKKDLDTNKIHKQNKTAVDIVETIVNWGKRYLKDVDGITKENFKKNTFTFTSPFFTDRGHFRNEIGMKDVSLAVNILLKMACLVDADGSLLSKRSISLLYDVIENKIFPLSDIEFGDWMSYFFKKISEQPKDYENCEIFTLMTSLFPHLKVKSLGSFIQQLQNNIVNLFECEINVLKSLITFLSKLIEEYPPNQKNKEFIVLYNNIGNACTHKYFLYNLKAMVLEAIGTYFPSCLNNIPKYFAMLVDNSLLFSFSDYTIALSVVLGFLNKIFFNISDSEKSTLFQKMMTLLKVEGLSSEIMLKMIGIMDLSTQYLMLKKNEETLTFQITDCVIKLFEGITNLIKEKFSHDKDICRKFSTVLMNLRHRAGFIRITNVHAVLGTISCQDQADCFKIVAKDLNYDVFSIISYICDDYWKTYDPWFKIKLSIYLLSSVFENIHIKSGLLDYETNHKVKFPFSMLVELCNSDEYLAKIVLSELFLCAWKILSDDKKKSLSPKVWEFISMCCEQCKEDEASSFLKYVFMETALKCHCQLPLNIKSEKICRSLDLQAECRRVLERNFSFEQSDMQQSEALQTLTDLYCTMEENDIQLRIDKFYTSYNNFTVSATEFYKRGEYLQAHGGYLKSLEVLQEKYSIHISVWEWKRCMEQMTRCVAELSNWENVESTNANYRVLSSIYPMSKCNALVNSPLKSFIIKSKGNTLEIEDVSALQEEDVYEAISQCINEWKSLPQGYLSPNHCTLLQLMQQFTELLEVYHLLDFKKVDSKCNHCLFTMKKKFEATASRWHFPPYSFSDDFSFISELFNVRQKSLEIYAKECHEISLHSIANQTTDLSNDFAIKLAFTGVHFQRMTEQNVRCREYTVNNAFELLKVKFTSIITNMRKLISQNKLDQYSVISINKKLDDLLIANYPIIEMFDRDKKGIIVLYDNKIRTTLDITVPFAIDKLGYEVPQMIEGQILIAEQFERKLQKSSSTEDAYLLICCLLNACKYGTPLDIQKLTPRILHCLEYDDENACLADELNNSIYRSDISHKYYIPYLPYFISIFINAIMERKACKEAITGILKMLSIKFPQQVFFSLESIRGVQPVKETEDKRNEIISFLREKHYVLAHKLDTVQEIFGQFEKFNYDYLVQLSQEALHKVYCIVDKNIKNEKLATERVLEYLDDHLMCKFFNKPLPLDLHNLIYKFQEEIMALNELKICSIEKVFNVLERFVSNFSDTSKELQPRFYSFKENNPVLSSQFMNSDVFLFDQILCVDHPSTVKIIKFYSKAIAMTYNNTLNYKIDVLGNDGKTYSFSLMNDVCRKETNESLKLMQLLECLNPLLESNHRCSRHSLKFNFSRYVSIDTHWKIVAYQNDEILLRDNMPFRDFKLYSGNYSAKDYFRKWMDKVYSHPSDFDRIKNKLLRELAVLSSAEFLNIHLKKQLVIHKRSGRLSISHLEMNEEEATSFSTLLSPDMKKYLLPIRIRVLAEYILDILACLKENEESYFLMTAVMHLMKKNLPGDEHHQCSWNVVEDIVENLLNVNLVAVENFLQQAFKSLFSSSHQM